MKTCFHSHFDAFFHASETMVFLTRFSGIFHQNSELRNGNDIHHFGMVLLIFQLGRGHYFAKIRPRKIPVSYFDVVFQEY